MRAREPLTIVEAAIENDVVVHAAHRRVNSHSWGHELGDRCVIVVEADPTFVFEVELARSSVRRGLISGLVLKFKCMSRINMA